MGEEFIEGNPAAKEAYKALRRRGQTHGEARTEITRVLLAVMWAVDRRYIDSTKANEVAPYPAFRWISNGEPASDLFHDNWRSEHL
ncbi:MAG: hypothetical protein V3T56_10470 [Gemmatimonadales bacterium]